MAEKELAILLTAKNMASGVIKRVKGDIAGLDSVSGRAGKGIRTMGNNLKYLGTAAVVGGVAVGFAAIKSGLDSLAVRESVIASTTAAIVAQGAAATVTAGEVRNWSEELERATGAAVDDKAIQASANTLIRFGVLSHDVFQRALTDATDLGAGLKTGPEAGAKLLGKALADPAKAMGALKKAGIVLTDAETKRIKQLVKGNKVQEAQVVLLEAVEKRYKGAAAASAGPYQRALNLLADASEDAKMALAEGFLPVLEKVADRLSMALADPKTIDDIRGLGKSLAGGFDAVLTASSQIPWDSIKSAMQMAGMGAKAAFDLFTGLPPWVQTAVLTGWGLNKLTGGAVSSIVGQLASGLIKGVLGMNAGVVNINAGIVNGGGPGIPGSRNSFLDFAKMLPQLLPFVVAAAAVEITAQNKGAFDPRPLRRRQGTTVADTVEMFGVNGPKGPIRSHPGPAFGPPIDLDKRRAIDAGILERATKAGFHPDASAIQATFERNAARADRNAMLIRDAILTAVPTVNVNVSSADISSRTANRSRVVKPNGSRGSMVGALLP